MSGKSPSCPNTVDCNSPITLHMTHHNEIYDPYDGVFTIKSAWWFADAWSCQGIRTSATNMMVLAGQCISGLSQRNDLQHILLSCGTWTVITRGITTVTKKAKHSNKRIVCIFLGHIVSIWHYSGVIMGAIASQITSLTIVYSTVYSDADQRKHQSSASLAFVWGIHWGPMNSPHKWPVTRKMFPLDDVIMNGSICTTPCPSRAQ